MSRILVVEPHKMLQQAFVTALFPEHQVQVSEAIPDTIGNVDIVVIDAGAMRRRGRLSALEIKRVQGWKIPLIWIDDESVADGAPVPDAIRLSVPIARDELRAAAARCVREAGGPQPAAVAKTARLSARGAARTKPEESQPKAASPDNKDIIELVEVFDEAELGESGVEARSKN